MANISEGESICVEVYGSESPGIKLIDLIILAIHQILSLQLIQWSVKLIA